MSLNRAIIMGRLGREPELRRTTNGTAVCSVSLAVDSDTKSEDGTRKTDWIDIVLWKGTAEFFCKYFHKGDTAIVMGRLQMRKWQDRDGKNRTALEIAVENVWFSGSRNDSSNTYNEADAAPEPVMNDAEEDGEIPF